MTELSEKLESLPKGSMYIAIIKTDYLQSPVFELLCRNLHCYCCYLIYKLHDKADVKTHTITYQHLHCNTDGKIV